MIASNLPPLSALMFLMEQMGEMLAVLLMPEMEAMQAIREIPGWSRTAR